MKAFVAKIKGRYLSMTVDGRNINIHESHWLEEGDVMKRPEGAHIVMIVESPDQHEIST